MIVVDASVLVELARASPQSDVIASHFEAHDFALHAPHLIDVEVLHALRSLALREEVPITRITEALADLDQLPITRHAHAALVPRAWELHRNVSAYDAMYLSLAEALVADGAPLLTADRRLARAAREHCAVDVLEVVASTGSGPG